MAAHTGSTVPAYVPDGDDMHDALQELELRDESGRLLDALQECAVVLGQPFERADRAAIDAQRRFRRLAISATICGSIALVVAGVRGSVLADVEGAQWLTIAELVLVSLTAIGVIWGLLAYRRESWFLQRVKAERLRLLKFSSLIDPRWWCGDEDARAEWKIDLRRGAMQIEQLQHHDLLHLSTDESPPTLPEREECNAIEGADVSALVRYYREHRLDVQRRYFRATSERDEQSLLSNPRLLPVAFFLGVVFVAFHALAELGDRASESAIFALLAVATPAAWTILRVYRSATEVARNASRSRARYVALTRIAIELERPRDAYHALSLMRMAEHVLDADQREWLRLMHEAEWYG